MYYFGIRHRKFIYRDLTGRCYLFFYRVLLPFVISILANGRPCPGRYAAGLRPAVFAEGAVQTASSTSHNVAKLRNINTSFAGKVNVESWW